MPAKPRYDVHPGVCMVQDWVAGLTLKVLTIDPPDVDRKIRVTVGADFNWLTPGLFNLFGAGFTNPVRLTGEAWMRNESPS